MKVVQPVVSINTCRIDHLDRQDEIGLPWGWHDFIFSTPKDRAPWSNWY